MDNKLILAVAGAGKTYKICNELEVDKRNIIIAYTNQNINNIRNELYKKYGEDSTKVRVITFHRFIYNYYILPYEPSYKACFKGTEKFKGRGIEIGKPPEKPKGYGQYNKAYVKKSEFGYYVKNNKYYLERIFELVDYDKCKKVTVRATKNLGRFIDNIYIDEFQDFRGFKYNFIKLLLKSFRGVTLVGDFYQHSTVGGQNAGKPYKNGKKMVTKEEFIKGIQKLGVEIDEVSLQKSRRCPKEICQFITENTGIKIYSEEINKGKVIWARDDEVKNILDDDSIIKLVYKDSKKYKFYARNWGYSKGDTYDSVCVILIKSVNQKIDRGEKIADGVTKNQLYVALSRTKGNLYIVTYDQFEGLKEDYS